MFIPDSANDCVRRVDAVTQNITTVAGIGGQPGSPVNGTSATSTKLNQPSGVAVDAAGNLYIADTQNAAIRKVNFATGQIATLIANGVGNALNASDALAPVQIYAPVGVYLDGAGNLFFADLYYMLVSKIDSSRGVLNFTATKVQLGSESPSPLVQTVENDGNASLNLTSLTNDANAVIDTVTTTCSLTSPLAQDTDCAIGAYFAPSLTIIIPDWCKPASGRRQCGRGRYDAGLSPRCDRGRGCRARQCNFTSLGLEPCQPVDLRTECYVYGDGFVRSDTHRQRGLHH